MLTISFAIGLVNLKIKYLLLTIVAKKKIGKKVGECVSVPFPAPFIPPLNTVGCGSLADRTLRRTTQLDILYCTSVNERDNVQCARPHWILFFNFHALLTKKNW